MFPCVLIAEEVPATLPGGRDIREKITVEGYFLRNYYYTRGGRVRIYHTAPLLVGRLTHQPDEAEPEGPLTARFTDWFWANRWTIVPVLAVFYIALRVAFRLTKPKPRPLPTSFSRSNDAIDPDELKQWVEGRKGRRGCGCALNRGRDPAMIRGVFGGPSSTVRAGDSSSYRKGGAGGKPPVAIRVNCGKPKPIGTRASASGPAGTAIRSQAWLGFGGQDGSETSGVSPNNTPRRRAPGLPHASGVSIPKPRRGGG